MEVEPQGGGEGWRGADKEEDRHASGMCHRCDKIPHTNNVRAPELVLADGLTLHSTVTGKAELQGHGTASWSQSIHN